MDTQAVQESTVCVTTSRYKSKIDNPSLLIKTPLPILDAEGYAVCPDCDSRVNCGTIGLANLEKRHRGKKICKAAQQKRDTEAKKKKDGNILSFLKPKATSVPSTVNSPAPVHNYKLAISKPVSEPISDSFIKKLRDLVRDLPTSIPEASELDILAVFGRNPKEFDDAALGVDELWKQG